MNHTCSELKDVLARADAIVIGAGAGLSTAAGLTYDGERFERYFGDFARRYGITDMYSGGFYRFETPEEQWAWWARHIYYNRYDIPPLPVYRELFSLVKDRNYFVLTTNVDHQFQNAGFDKERLFYTQGDYGCFQCAVPCVQKTWDNEAQVRAMLAAESNMKIPTELVPKCPHCGGPVIMHLRSDNRFVEDAGWHAAQARYQDFLMTYARTGQVLFLELGVGFNTPGIIKYPFWQLTAYNPNAVYACVNLENACTHPEIAARSICIRADISEVLQELR